MLIEEREHRQGIGHAAIEADKGDRTATAHHVDRRVKGLHSVNSSLLQHPLPDRIWHGTRYLLCEPAGGRAVGLHTDRLDHRVSPPTIGHLTYLPGDVVVILQV